mmetsp:Transcript_30059/g.87545  ORF Transcript_30059/g.87545 Transcript_30059/m.87545 type:complete len:492 (+) Transcript_30059:1172-2647(+)
MVLHRPTKSPMVALENAVQWGMPARLWYMPRHRKLQLAWATLLVSLLCLGLRFGIQTTVELYPEWGAWESNLCREEDLWPSRERYIRHHPALDNPLFRGALSLLTATRPAPPSERLVPGAPLILVGTHHKTGTVLAKKLFGTTCLRLKQCCSFHVTADPKEAVVRSASREETRLTMHLQWAWMPQAVAPPARGFRFIHFYRNPFAKLISGYNYHRSGSEPWTERYVFEQSEWCRAPAVTESVCHEMHPCRDCCTELYHQRPGAWERGRRFLCAELREVDAESLALKPMLDTLSVEQGLRVEAGVGYFESYVMAMIVNRTANDPNTLNLDLDRTMQDYDASVNAILDFIRPSTSSQAWKQTVDQHRSWIVAKAQVFDLGHQPSTASSLYESVYSSKLYSHLASSEDRLAAQVTLNAMICANDRLALTYEPIIQMIQGTDVDIHRYSCAAWNATRHPAPRRQTVTPGGSVWRPPGKEQGRDPSKPRSRFRGGG